MGKGRERGKIRVLAFVFPLCMMEDCLPGDGKIFACWWEVMNELLIFTVQAAFALPIKASLSQPMVFTLLPSRSSPPSHCRGVSVWLGGA